MILQALHRYYEQLQEHGTDRMPSEYYSSADVSFEIHLDGSGQVVSVIPYVNDKGKAMKRNYLVPKQEKRTSGIKPFFLCDKAEYLFGSSIGLRESCRDEMRIYWDEILAYASQSTPEINAIRQFVSIPTEDFTIQLSRVVDSSIIEMLRSGGLCVLKYTPTGHFFHENQTIRHCWEEYVLSSQGENSDQNQICLVTGKVVPANQIARLHPTIKNVIGAQTAGAALVSFNIDSFCSYYRDQSYNAPTSQQAADAYGYALNKLLSDNRHKTRLNDMTVVFWTETVSGKENDLFFSLFQEQLDESELQQESIDADSVQSRLKASMERIRAGQTFRDTFHDLKPDITYYMLGLSPNAARLSVRLWNQGTIGEIGDLVWQHFRDLSIIGLERSPSVKQMLREIAVGHEWKNIPPNLEGQLLRSVLLGLPYPRALFTGLMNRIRSESDDPRKSQYKIGALRAGMIKAYLLRHARRNNNKMMEGELTMALNENSTSTPYHLGRLFACLEKTQESALGQGINATIKDRYWGAASTMPSTVFPRLLSLAQHHLSKDEKWGRSNDFRIQEVMNGLPERLPARLTLEEQGMFAIGYYHQKQDFYIKKNDEAREKQ